MRISSFGLSTISGGSSQPPSLPTKIGGGVDAHGCSMGAGMSWCAARKACVQPWVVAKEQNIGDVVQGGMSIIDPVAYDAYCNGPSATGLLCSTAAFSILGKCVPHNYAYAAGAGLVVLLGLGIYAARRR